MSVPFSGLNTTVDFSATSASNYLDQVKNALVSVNWSAVVAGSGYDITSATTPQGLHVIVEFRISGGSINATVRDVTSSVQYAPAITVYASGQLARIVACPYQFFLYYPGSTTFVNFLMFMVGVPFIPAFLQAGTSEAWWSMNHRDVSLSTFRAAVVPTAGKQAAFNGALINSEQNGQLQIIPPRSVAGGNPTSILWYDSSSLDAECLIGWPKSGNGGDTVAIGIMWDMVCIWQAFPWEDEQAFGGKTWVNISSSTMTPSLWVVK